MFKHVNHFRFPLFLIALGMISLYACSREQDPRSDVQRQISSLRFDSTMTAEEYQSTSQLLQHPLAAPAGTPTPPRAQAAMSNRVYNLTYADYATVTVGGATYSNTINAWSAGASAGNFAIPPSAFTQLTAALSHQLRIVIGDNPYAWWPDFTLRTITFTMIDKNNEVLSGGMYTTDTRNYLYLGGGTGVGGQVGSTTCGVMTYGSLHGWMAPNYATTTGYVSYNIIAGCAPVVVGATIQFFFTGIAQP